MLTSLKNQRTYTAQITPYGSKVHAEIVYTDKDKFFYDRKIELWHTAMHKSFGKTFASHPREQDYIDAKNWINEQLELIKKHATAIVAEPVYLKETEY